MKTLWSSVRRPQRTARRLNGWSSVGLTPQRSSPGPSMFGAPLREMSGRIRRLRSPRRLGLESVSLVAERYGLGPRSQVYGRTWISA